MFKDGSNTPGTGGDVSGQDTHRAQPVGSVRLAEDYPLLVGELSWRSTRGAFSLRPALPPEEFARGINAVAFVADRPVIIRIQGQCGGFWDLPGGTREPGETILDTVRRELMEEAGARVFTYQPFGGYLPQPSAPDQANLPYGLIGYAEAELIGPPRNSPGAERVLVAEAVPLAEACRRFAAEGNAWLGEVYRLAAALRRLPPLPW